MGKERGKAARGSGRVLLAFALLAVVVGVLALGAAGALAVVRPWEAAPAAPSGTPAVLEPDPDPPAVLAGAGAEAPALEPAQVHSAIDDLVAGSGLGGGLSVAVVDAAAGTSLYGQSADTPVVPASTTKLVTAASVLATRGPAYQIPTTAVAGAEPGEVILVGGGDPTLSIDGDGFYPGAARLDLLASQVLSALGDTPVTRVVVDASRFSGPVHGPWTPDIPTGGFVGPITALMADGARVDPDPGQGQQAAARWDEPDLAVGEAFAAQLGLGVTAAPVTRGEAPAGATVLGEVTSLPILRLVEIMLTGSDNVVGEMLARQVALARDEPASFAGAAAAMTAVLTKDMGLSLGDSELADGSGLSRENRLSAQLLTDLLAAAADEARPQLAGVFAGLPVAGWSGTLATRHDPPPAEVAPGVGVVRAKTGSLTGVDALAGVVVTSGGRLLAFAVLADEVPIGRPASWVALDRIPATLATL